MLTPCLLLAYPTPAPPLIGAGNGLAPLLTIDDNVNDNETLRYENENVNPNPNLNLNPNENATLRYEDENVNLNLNVSWGGIAFFCS